MADEGDVVNPYPGQCLQEGDGFSYPQFKEKSEQISKECFDFIDHDKNGVIDKAELITVMRGIGLNPSEKDAEELIASTAETGKDTISWAVFDDMMNGPCKSEKLNKMNMLAMFLIFDNNKDGFVDATDFQKTMIILEQPFGEFETKLFIEEMDKKPQGKLNYKDFVTLMYGESYAE
uniref:EF-hand domain-containing protein n=2 Tax=Magallana gigas TaxID=29159 RepID=A0A8W8HUV4_MAGGI|nr:calmodulin-beta isoform X3 [Crassostrea gigas]